MVKGFTLVELLAVIVILAIVSVITVPVVTSVINDSKNKASKEQINILEDAARKYVSQNDTLFSSDDTKTYFITLKTLKNNGFLDGRNIINPKTKTEFTGCVKVVYIPSTTVGGKYTYTYVENGCP